MCVLFFACFCWGGGLPYVYIYMYRYAVTCVPGAHVLANALVLCFGLLFSEVTVYLICTWALQILHYRCTSAEHIAFALMLTPD